MADFNTIDISETFLNDFDHEVMTTLLMDHTTHKNIMWCCDDYAHLGEGYAASDEITIEKITGEHDRLIRPRALKSKEVQKGRTRKKAEVFTPSWVCNAQSNLIDGAWFGREGVFNTENTDHTWTVNHEKIIFPEGKTWRDYVHLTCLEITCGEAPYLASRYDTTTGEYIPVSERIGLLDRKLRVINENVDDHEEWLKWVKIAYQNIYGYEWQGDNLLLAREALLQSFFEYHSYKFGNEVPFDINTIREMAHIISWNIWQMDGLKCVVPMSCKNTIIEETDLFGEVSRRKEECVGCKKNDMHRHNGLYCDVMDWEENHPIKFVSLIKKQ